MLTAIEREVRVPQKGRERLYTIARGQLLLYKPGVSSASPCKKV